MPNQLRNWPNILDPRSAEGGPAFCWNGFKNAYPAAWRYRVTITGAPPPYNVFNGVWFLDWVSCTTEFFGECKWEFVLLSGHTVRLYKWWDPPGGTPDEFSWGLEVEAPGPIPVYSFGNGNTVSRPLPSDDLPPFTMVAHVPTWTDPLLVKPRKWNATT